MRLSLRRVCSGRSGDESSIIARAERIGGSGLLVMSMTASWRGTSGELDRVANVVAPFEAGGETLRFWDGLLRSAEPGFFEVKSPSSIASSSESSAELRSSCVSVACFFFLLLTDGAAAVALRARPFFFPFDDVAADADFVRRGPKIPASISSSSESSSSACSKSTGDIFFLDFAPPFTSSSLTLTKPREAPVGTLRSGLSSRLRLFGFGESPVASDPLREERSSRTYSSISISISTHSGSISSGSMRSTSPYTSRSEARTMKCWTSA